jgi:hypothetical protein
LKQAFNSWISGISGFQQQGLQDVFDIKVLLEKKNVLLNHSVGKISFMTLLVKQVYLVLKQTI